MKKLIIIIISFMMLMVVGCASEKGIKCYDISNSGCMSRDKSRALDTAIQYGNFYLGGGIIDNYAKFQVTLILDGNCCNIEVQNHSVNCAGWTIPSVITEDSVLIIRLGRGHGNLLAMCECFKNVSFKCTDIAQGRYKLYVSDYHNEKDYYYVDGEVIELYDREPVTFYHYVTNYGTIVDLSDEDKEFLEDYWAGKIELPPYKPEDLYHE